MGCNIVTGIALSPSVSPKGTCLVASPGKRVLFSPTTPAGTDRSEPITITPGNAILIDAYNMKVDLHIYIDRVVVTSECITQGNACADDMKSAGQASPVIVFRERLTVGNNPDNWTLCKYSDSEKVSRCQLLLAIPGTYQLELESPDEQLGDLEVEYQMFKLSDLGMLPKNYFGGID